MKTAGYDFVGEINEILVNRALAAAFYTTTIPNSIEGSLTPSGTPPTLLPYARIDYKIRLKEPPTVDAFTGNNIRILFNVEVALKVLGGLRLEFDVTASVLASPTYDQANKKLTIDLKNAKVDDVEINDTYDLPQDVLEKFNSVIQSAISTDILDQVETIDIVPILHFVELPDMPPGPSNQLTISLGNVKILNQNVIAVCINFLEYNGGNITHVTDFSEGLDFSVGVSEAAMHRVFDFWWNRTTHPKSASIIDKCDLPDVVDRIINILGGIPFIASKLASLGFVEVEFRVKESWMDYGATVRFNSKPNFNLKNGKEIEFSNFDLNIDVWAKPKVTIEISIEFDTSGPIPDWLTPWKDDIVSRRKISTMTLVDLSVNRLDVTIENAIAEVYLDDQNRIMAKLKDFDLNIDLGSSWIDNLGERAVNWIIDQIENMIKNKIPPFPLSPALITTNVPGTTLVIDVDIDKLTTDENESIVGASINFNNMGKTVIPVPKFIANRNPLSLEVHRADCQWVDTIWEKNKVGYFVLMDALKDGYNGCKYCLPEYNKG